MRVIIFLLMIIMIIAKPAFTQAPSKTEIQAKMSQAFNSVNDKVIELEKRLAEAKKNKEDPDTIKSLEDEIILMKKQLTMMKGVNSGISNMSEKTIKQATENENLVVPKKDLARINSLSKKILTETELTLFIKNIKAGVEKLIPAVERTEALNIYNETKAKYKTTAIVANAASSCWMLGHWEKALFIMGKSCTDDITDADNLNNYAAFLIMTGGEQAALPIIEYLNSKYPDNSTILNNMGQAWFGLGDMDNARKYLKMATDLYSNHSMANSTLSDISAANNDAATAISELKASLKETYDPEKEQRLRKLGYEIKFEDMPRLNYPMKDDPFGLIPLIKSWNPEKIQSSIDDGQSAVALQAYVKGVQTFGKELEDESTELDKKLKQRGNKLAVDSSYRRQFLDPYNCPAYLLASRSFQLYCFEKSGVCFKKFKQMSPFMTGLFMPLQNPLDMDMWSVTEIVKWCDEMWFEEVLKPISKLTEAMSKITPTTENCTDYDKKIDIYLAKRKEIYAKGVQTIQGEFIGNSNKLTEYIKMKLYGSLDDPPIFMNDYSSALISDIEARIDRRQKRNKDYELVLSLIAKSQEFQNQFTSACQKQLSTPEAPDDILAPLKVKEVECEYIKRVTVSDDYVFELQCNTIKEKINPKLKKKNPDVNRGSTNTSKRKNSSRGPVQSHKGPNISLEEIDVIDETRIKGPLTSENQDISQFSLEYNKWGNFVGFNFQLSEDGSTLKDPDSIESGVDSRWSWNAIASPKKGYMYKLLMK